MTSEIFALALTEKNTKIVIRPSINWGKIALQQYFIETAI